MFHINPSHRERLKERAKCKTTHPAADVVDDEMIQSRLERLLMSDDAFCAVAVRLIAAAIALAVHNTQAADEQRQMNKRFQNHFGFIL